MSSKINPNEKNATDAESNHFSHKQVTTTASIFTRDGYIDFLSHHLYEILMLKKEISDDRLRKHHLSSKGIGDDLYYLTESYFRQKEIYRGKHSMTDFITPAAREAMELGNISGNLNYDHMVPKNIYIKRISEITLAGQLTQEFIYNLLIKYYYVCTVTKKENNILPSSNMGNGWDGINPFYRYEHADIEFLVNEKY